jgi:hypothetical protein
MPAEPIEYQIVRNLQSALQLITVVGGYHFTVAATAVKLDPNQGIEALIAPTGPRPFIVIEVKPETRRYSPAKRTRLVLPVTIHWVSESTPTIDESRLQTYFRGCADVERAIAIDIGRGGLATDTQIVDCVYDTAIDGAQVWAQINIEISINRIYGQPDA